jgi:hypothetical protein
MKRTSEKRIALAIRTLLARRADKRMTLDELRQQLPRVLHLTKADKATSASRPTEPKWHQVFRNLRSHGSAPDYGLRITPDGFALATKVPAYVTAKLREIAAERRVLQ